METRVQRAFQSRWVAAAATIAVGYIGLWVMVHVIQGAYYDYYQYPRMKGAEYSYPELRYSIGQAAILLWSLLGLCAAALAGRYALFRTGGKWAGRSALAFAVGFVVLVVGFIVGAVMRDFGF